MKALFTHGFAAILCACSAAAIHAQAPAYPAKPVRIVVGFAAGGGTDIAARIVAQQLTESLGQSFVVDNRPGASGTIAAEIVARAQPDGYTLIVGTQTNYAVAPALYGKVGYDAARDFAPITVIASSPLLLVVHPSLPVNSVAQLIALAKSRPGQLTFGVGGAGTTRPIIAKLNAETVRAMNLPDVKDKMAAQGLFVVAGTAEEFSTYLKAEIAKWATVVKDSGAKAD